MTNHFFVHRNGWKLLPFLLLVCPCCCLPDGDLCRWMNGRKYYIDVGESGIISAENVTSQSATSAPTASSVEPGQSEPNQPQIPQRCSVELITCPSCHFEVKALRISIPTCSSDKSCRCDFVWIKEAAYSKSGQEFCGYSDGNSSDLVFESKTKLVSVDFLYSGTYTSAFALQFSAIKNVYIFKGGYEHFPNNSTGEISSPNFPGGYPSDYSAEYILQNVDPSGFVQLLFTDFQLSLWSYMEILDSNGSRIDVYNGNTFRPPALISSGPAMTVKFQANDEYPSSGFLASYNFVGYSERYWINRPSTECGGFVEDYGGAITMMNMVPSNMMRAFDCIWLIHPRNSHVPGKQISVRVSQFDDMGAKSTLSIRQGLYSRSPLLETVTPFHHHKIHRGQEYVVPASVGLYIRLVGFFSNKSHLAIIYSTFHYDSCYAIGDFECGNGRCIKNSLRCDGFNHCGDGTDESSCYGAQQGTPSPEDANWWRTLTPNYYFPKTDNSNNTGTNTLILVTSLAGLGMFVLTTVVILVKLHKQRQDDNISREILQTISADIEAENAAHHHHVPSDPPMYDPPPSYDDVIKFYLPPPPAYSAIGTNQAGGIGHGRNAPDHRRDGNAGNAAMKARTRRKKPSRQVSSTHRDAQPSVLRVALPEESEEPVAPSRGPEQPPGTSHRSDFIPSVTRTVADSDTNRQSAHESNRKPVKYNNDPKSFVPYEYQSSLTNGSQAFDRSHSANVLPVDRKFPRSGGDGKTVCECQGACSCSSEKAIECGVARSAAIRSETHESGGDTATSLGFQCMASRGVDSPSHETANDELLPASKPSRSKSFNGSNEPFSPTTSPNEAPSPPNDDQQQATKDSAVNLRRSSSGPSEVSHASTRSEADRRLESSSSNMIQVKSLASTIFGGLQQSIFRGACSDSALGSDLQQKPTSSSSQPGGGKSDKSNAPYSWSNLWYATKKRSEKEELFNPIKECIPSDTQPLILSSTTKNGLGEAKDNNSSAVKEGADPKLKNS